MIYPKATCGPSTSSGSIPSSPVFPELEEEDRPEVARTTRHLIHLADIYAVTTGAQA